MLAGHELVPHRVPALRVERVELAILVSHQHNRRLHSQIDGLRRGNKRGQESHPKRRPGFGIVGAQATGPVHDIDLAQGGGWGTLDEGTEARRGPEHALVAS